MGYSEWVLLSAPFFCYVCRLTNISKSKGGAVKCWKGDVLWDMALSYMCVWVLKWFCQMRSFKSSRNLIFSGCASWDLVFGIHCIFTPRTAECVENGKQRNDGWILKSQQMSYLRWMDGWIERLTRLSETGKKIRKKNGFIKPSKIDWLMKSGNYKIWRRLLVDAVTRVITVLI